LAAAGIKPEKRAEELSLEAFLSLSAAVEALYDRR
jgi:16S rRNA A1518/A1519 N6-dimethyltransferase RsmA/KsgA/DIM1 with predicted DNA glycosylase/AP lyase activity